jgi:AcrR family transcriptional regulator
MFLGERIMGRTSQEGKRRGPAPKFDRDDMLDRLVGLFWRAGYERTSHADMRAVTGLSGSSLYNAFGDKQSIFDAVLARYHERTAVLVAPLVDGTSGLDDVLEWVDLLRLRIMSHDTPPGCLMIATMGSPIGREQEVRAHTERNLERVRASVTAALVRAADRGEIPVATIEARAALLAAGYIGILSAARASTTRELAHAMLDGTRDVLGTWLGGG